MGGLGASGSGLWVGGAWDDLKGPDQDGVKRG